MEPVAKLSCPYRVMVQDVDFTKKLKLSAAFNYFQEIASVHADNLGIGFNAIRQKHDLVWVLTRMRVEMLRYPLWDEVVTVETWPQLPRKYEFDRDYIMKDQKGNILAKAVSVWVILDIKSRQLQKSEVIAVDYPEMITDRATDFPIGKLRPAGSRQIAYKKVIGCSDIDMNGHLNNSKYLDFIMDCFSMEALNKYQAKSIQVNYLDEAFPGEPIIFYKYTDELDSSKVYVEGVNEEKGNTIFKCGMDIAAI